MLLISNGLYRILEPKTNKLFRIWAILIGIAGAILLVCTHFHIFSILVIPVALLIVVISLTSGYSQEYDLRERKIYYKRIIKFGKRGDVASVSIFQTPNRELEVYYIVSALYGFRFEQTPYEKKRDIGRIYFNGTTRVEADRPFTAYEKSVIPTPHSYELYGVENFERIKETLMRQLPPEKFINKNDEI